MTDLSSYFEPYVSFETDPSKLAYLVNVAGDRIPVSREAIVHASQSKNGYIVISLYGGDVDDENFQKGKAEPETNEIPIMLPWATKLMLERVAHFAELHFQSPMHTIPAPLETATVEALSQCENPAPWVHDFAKRLRTPHDPALTKVTPQYVKFYDDLTNLADFLFIVRLQELLAATLGSIVKPDPLRPMGPEGFREELKRLQKIFCIPDKDIDAIEEKSIEELKAMFPAVYSTEPMHMWEEE